MNFAWRRDDQPYLKIAVDRLENDIFLWYVTAADFQNHLYVF